MRVDDILEILEKYKLRIPPNVFYELKADICNHEEYKEPTTKNDLEIVNDLGVDTDKLISDCEKMSFDIEFFNKSLKVVALDAVKNIVKDLPLITSQELRWIPVSERLPKDSGEYLVSVTDKEDERYKQVGVAWFAHPKDYDMKDGEWRELMIDEVVTAWMELPQPYREL